ncbi:MAG: fumarylacetoacetate hydrolase family protein [Marinosulfonomonas sp.]|nr:fumarylacetoacetate hydrolase family protein [Marinosulfonomonas sp.]
MKLATLLDNSRDGRLVVVSTDLERYVLATDISATLQGALDDWAQAKPALQSLSDQLNSGAIKGEAFDQVKAASPLPRAYQWLDGSAYLNHGELVRKARNAQMPKGYETDPIMYQGGSDSFTPPHHPIELITEDWGIDFESEIAVITDDVPMGVTPAQAGEHIQLVVLVNDVSLRALIPDEMAKSLGLIHSKSSSAFSPVAVTPDELGKAWQDGKLHLPLLSTYNGALFGKPNGGRDMTFSFPDLIAHAAKSRVLSAGSIVGSGTVSNKLDGGPGKPVPSGGSGYSCIAEIRMIETILDGAPKTPYMSFGDTIRIEMNDANGKSIFGSIDQVIKKHDV